jgi:hypothetical protein
MRTRNTKRMSFQLEALEHRLALNGAGCGDVVSELAQGGPAEDQTGSDFGAEVSTVAQECGQAHHDDGGEEG